MKKLFVMLSCVLMLAACGGGGGGSAANTTNPQVGAQGSITISLTPATKSSAKQLALSTLPVPTNIRFLVRNATTGFSVLQDVAVLTTTTATIAVPVATGYTVEVISYVSGYQFNSLLKYNIASGIDVSANANTSVNVVLQPITPTISIPSTVVVGGPLTVTTNFPSPLMASYALQVSTSPFTGVAPDDNIPYTISDISSSNTHDMNAPSEASAGNLYFRGIYQINYPFVSSSDTWANTNRWILIYPNAYNGDAPVSMPYTIPTGGISLGVTY